jgi:anti-sigma regulatory factor (Ser/Thr protein kinase)
MQTDIAVRLPAVPASVPRARQVLARLDGVLDESLLVDLRLMVSELVTNSIRHAGLGHGEEIDLRILVERRKIRVEVGDPGHGFQPPAEPPDELSGSGWGLFLVDRLASRWGVASGVETTVWFEIDR